MRVIALQVIGLVACVSGVGYLIYFNERWLGALITALAAGLLLMGFAVVIGLAWYGLRSLARSVMELAAPPPRPSPVSKRAFVLAQDRR